MELPQSCDKPAINSLVINYGISDIIKSEFDVFEVNYGISNTTVLEIPQFTTKTARYPITQLYATAMFDREKEKKESVHLMTMEFSNISKQLKFIKGCLWPKRLGES